MKPLDLREFAERLRLEGNEFADEILEALELQPVVDEFVELCEDIERYTPEALKDKPAKAVEWLGERSDELNAVYELFPEGELGGCGVRDAIRERLVTLEDVTDILKGEGWDGDGDLVETLRHTLANWPPKLEYDL